MRNDKKDRLPEELYNTEEGARAVLSDYTITGVVTRETITITATRKPDAVYQWNPLMVLHTFDYDPIGDGSDTWVCFMVSGFELMVNIYNKALHDAEPIPNVRPVIVPDIWCSNWRCGAINWVHMDEGIQDEILDDYDSVIVESRISLDDSRDIELTNYRKLGWL